MLQSMEQKLQRMLEGSDLPLKELAKELMKIRYDIADQKKFFITIWELNETIDELILAREQTTQSLHDIINATPNQP